MLAKLGMIQTSREAVCSKASLTLEIFGRPKDNQLKAQISSISFTIYTKLLYSGVVSTE